MSHWWKIGRLKGTERNHVLPKSSPAEAVLPCGSSSLCTAPASVVPAAARSPHNCPKSYQRPLAHCFLQLHFLDRRSSLLLLLTSGLFPGPHLVPPLSQCNQFPVSIPLSVKDLQGFLFLLLFYSSKCLTTTERKSSGHNFRNQVALFLLTIFALFRAYYFFIFVSLNRQFYGANNKSANISCTLTSYSAL